MRLIAPLALATLLLTGPAALAAKVMAPSLRDQQQAACYDDVNKFCKDDMPDVDKVTACMKTKKSMVSAKCAAMWDVAD